MKFPLCYYTHGENKKCKLAVRFLLQFIFWNSFYL
jgi:hypothetical protein